MHLTKNNKIKSLINIFPENMVHFIFFLKTSHLMEQHKIGFIIFGSQKQEIWFLQESPKIKILNKRKGGKEVTLQWTPSVRSLFLTAEATFTGDFSATVRSPAKPRASAWSPNPNDSIDPLFPTAEPPEWACRRRWRLGGGARRYARALRPVERNLRPSTAPADYGEAS